MDSKCKLPKVQLSDKSTHHKDSKPYRKGQKKESDNIPEVEKEANMPPGNSWKNNLPSSMKVPNLEHVGSTDVEFDTSCPNRRKNINFGSSSGSSTLTDQHVDTEQKEHSGQDQFSGDNMISNSETHQRIENPSICMKWLLKDEIAKSSDKSDLERIPALVCWNSDKIEAKALGEEKAKAMESLLELCAQLLKRERLEELAGVLKPFGEEAVSSRETAIWLTKGLINIQRPNGEA